MPMEQTDSNAECILIAYHSLRNGIRIAMAYDLFIQYHPYDYEERAKLGPRLSELLIGNDNERSKNKIASLMDKMHTDLANGFEFFGENFSECRERLKIDGKVGSLFESLGRLDEITQESWLNWRMNDWGDFELNEYNEWYFRKSTIRDIERKLIEDIKYIEDIAKECDVSLVDCTKNKQFDKRLKDIEQMLQDAEAMLKLRDNPISSYELKYIEVKNDIGDKEGMKLVLNDCYDLVNPRDGSVTNDFICRCFLDDSNIVAFDFSEIEGKRAVVSRKPHQIIGQDLHMDKTMRKIFFHGTHKNKIRFRPIVMRTQLLKEGFSEHQLLDLDLKLTKSFTGLKSTLR